jgi:tRNA (guanine-N7-)-methyltransferase
VLGGGAKARFPHPEHPLSVEIGPGEDDFLLDQARAHPETNWLGIEYSSKRVRRYVRRVRTEAPGLDNLRLIWRPAADLVEPFLTPEVVSAYYVNFPDPWPKKHHARYRLVSPEFAAALARSLVPGGFVQLSTDVPEYAAEIHAAFSGAPGMTSAYPPPGYAKLPPGSKVTVFEERWRAAGRDIHYLRFAKPNR